MAQALLKDLAFTRSGDKGDVANIGVMATTLENFEILRRQLTPERVKAFFGEMVTGAVEVYTVPNLNAFNVVLRGGLGGGATRTLRFDQTGKSMCTVLLRLPIEVG